jgi:hypothetical protein
MFYTQEDVQPAVDAAVRIFGKNGSYVFDGNVKNVVIATREFGKIWNGDVDVNSVENKCTQLARQIGNTVYLLEGFYADNFDFSKAYQFNSN